jgi:hypothetical protein
LTTTGIGGSDIAVGVPARLRARARAACMTGIT